MTGRDRSALDRAVLDWIAEGVVAGVQPAHVDDARFDEIALALFRYQHVHNAPYRRLCEAFGRDPSAVKHWSDIPAVPTGAFKEARLATFPPDDEVAVFRSSGSTGERRGALHLDTLALYRASALETFRAFVVPDLHDGARIRFAVLAPSPEELPDSSLSHMFGLAVEHLGTDDSGYFVGRDGWDPDAVIDELARAAVPVAVVGTAFAFVRLLDRLAERALEIELPAGSRALETGGFKGRSREVTREELHGSIGAALRIPAPRILNQYGMCELGSQFYEDSIATGLPSRRKLGPPWVRTRVVDPATLTEVARGERGLLVHYDLANTGSVLAVQTSDVGRALPDGGFDLFGRLPGAEAKGCSLAADALLRGS